MVLPGAAFLLKIIEIFFLHKEAFAPHASMNAHAMYYNLLLPADKLYLLPRLLLPFLSAFPTLARYAVS